MSRADLDDVLEAIRDHRGDVRERYRIDMIGVAGSFARGEATSESDIDIVVDFLPGTTLFKIGGLLSLLEDRLHRPVDLLDLKALKPRIKASIERDLVPA